jgi:hypothetical protein
VLLGQWRAEHDWTAAHGLPTHVTVRVPLPHAIGAPSLLPLVEAHLPVTVTLRRIEDRPGALVAVAEPDDALRALTAAIDEVLPGLPPHRGDRPDLTYHATIVRTSDARVRAAAKFAIAPRLPLTETADELCAFEWSGREELRIAWRAPLRLVH